MTAEDVGRFALILAEQGVRGDRGRRREEPGQGEAIRFLAPGLEATVELVFEIDRPLAPPALRSKLPSNSARFSGAAVRRLDHVNLATGLDRLGEAEAGCARCSASTGASSSACRTGRSAAAGCRSRPRSTTWRSRPTRKGRTGRLNHIAFNLEEFADICRLADVIAEHDIHVDVPPSRHGITQGHCYYVRDPGSGHRVELFSGGYLIFDPDWEPIEWSVDELDTHGLVFVGPPEWTRQNNPNAENTPATVAERVAR